jgi:hypothetical protein
MLQEVESRSGGGSEAEEEKGRARKYVFEKSERVLNYFEKRENERSCVLLPGRTLHSNTEGQTDSREGENCQTDRARRVEFEFETTESTIVSRSGKCLV